MEYRVLGRTNFKVSAVGVGGIPIQRVDVNATIDILKEALNQGINFIDTARGYTVSEDLIGQALEVVGRDNFILATKSMARTYEAMNNDLKTSLKNLRTDHIDLYQLHNVKSEKDYEAVMADDGALRALKEAKENGVIKAIGVTSHSADMLDKIIESGEFESIQFPYNAVESQGTESFKKAKENNIGIIVMKPLAGGALQKGELAIRYVLDNPNVSVAIPGMDNVEQVIENALAGNDRREMTEAEKEAITAEASALGTEFCRRCGYCAPCSQGIDIPSQFLFEGYYNRYELKGWSTDRYTSQAINASHCIECGECEPRCPYDLPIIDMLKRVSDTFATK